MLKSLLAAPIRAFERRYDYDMSYARELLEIDTAAFLKFGRVTALSQYCRDLPIDAAFAAKLVGTLHEDCGPCTQLVVTMAEAQGVAPTTLKAILQRQPDALPADAQLGYRFAEAVLMRHPDADTLRQAVVARWGRRALVSLAFGLLSARLYPTLKYALGHAHTCVRVQVAGEALAVAGHA
jgi:HrpA-like RNA helicase